MPWHPDLHILQPIDQLPLIEELVFDMGDLLPVVVLRNAFPAAEAAAGLGNGPHHAGPILPRPEVGVNFRRKLESVEVAADEPIGVELLISGEEFPVDCEPSVIIAHSEEYSYYTRSTLCKASRKAEKA